jgi:hypothetical protein
MANPEFSADGANGLGAESRFRLEISESSGRTLTTIQLDALRTLASADRSLQTADLRKLLRLTTVEARTVCMQLLKYGYVERRLKMVSVRVGTRSIRRARAFWSLNERGWGAMGRG